MDDPIGCEIKKRIYYLTFHCGSPGHPLVYNEGGRLEWSKKGPALPFRTSFYFQILEYSKSRVVPSGAIGVGLWGRCPEPPSAEWAGGTHTPHAARLPHHIANKVKPYTLPSVRPLTPKSPINGSLVNHRFYPPYPIPSCFAPFILAQLERFQKN